MLNEPDTFIVPKPPRIVVAAASYPKQQFADGEALLRSAYQKLRIS